MEKDARAPTPMETQCEGLRNRIFSIAEDVLAMKLHDELDREESHFGQLAEIKANIMLSYRHLEDARMRIGKVMQQIQGGVSIFDRQEQEKAMAPTGSSGTPDATKDTCEPPNNEPGTAAKINDDDGLPPKVERDPTEKIPEPPAGDERTKMPSDINPDEEEARAAAASETEPPPTTEH